MLNLEIINEAVTKLISANAEPETICTGFEFTEGPIWHPAEQCLYFSDMPGDVRRRWSPADGVSEAMRPSNKCNGMTLDGKGNLLVCEHSTSRVMRETPAGEREVLASHWEGKELNSPNDVIIGNNGVIYFSDPAFGRLPGFGIEREQQLDFQGVFSIAPDGTLSLEADDFGQPNGLCMAPDGKTLYINDTERAHIRAFDVGQDGHLSNSRVFFEGIGNGELAGGIVDGMKCDELGNIYVTGPRGLWVISPEAELLGVIRLPEHAANHNWGGPDWKDLYCTCSTSVYRLRMNVRGNSVPHMSLTRS